MFWLSQKETNSEKEEPLRHWRQSRFGRTEDSLESVSVGCECLELGEGVQKC